MFLSYFAPRPRSVDLFLITQLNMLVYELLPILHYVKSGRYVFFGHRFPAMMYHWIRPGSIWTRADSQHLECLDRLREQGVRFLPDASIVDISGVERFVRLVNIRASANRAGPWSPYSFAVSVKHWVVNEFESAAQLFEVMNTTECRYLLAVEDIAITWSG